MLCSQHAVMTLPLALASQVAVGASFALISRHSDAHQPWLRSVAVWALLCLQLLVIMPATAYGLWRYAAWSMHYWWEAGPSTGWTLLCPVMGLLGFGVARAGILRGRVSWGWAALGVGLVTDLILVIVNGGRLAWVGTAAQFQAHSGDLLPLGSSGVGYLLTVGLPAQVAAWAFTLWRLYLLDRASVLSGDNLKGKGEAVPEISAQLLSVAKPAGGTRQLS